MSAPDFALETTWDFKFTTRAFATGIPTTLAGTPVIDIYEDNSITQITVAETLTVDFDGVTGLHNLRIAMTAANGFATDSSYSAVITTGTVGGVSVVGEVVCNFTVEKQSALRPTTAGRTLDVLATGEVPIDFDTSIGTLAAAQIEAGALDGKGDWNIGKTGYSLTQAFPTNFADLAIAVTTGEVTVGTNNDKTGYSMATAGIAAASFAAGAINAAAIAANAIGASQLATDAIGDAQITTGAIASTAFAAGAIDAAALATDAVTEIRDSILPVQNTTLDNIPFTFVAASDGRTPVTGATGTAVTRSIDGGAFGAGTGTITEIANGAYQYDASAADMNGGKILFRFTATGGTPGAPDDTFITVVTGAGV